MEFFNKKYWYQIYINGLANIRTENFIEVDKNTFKKTYLNKDFYFYKDGNKKVPYSFTFHLNNIWFPRFKYANGEIIIK